jgi:hypothetical protein
MIEPDHARLSIVRQCELASISRSFYREPAVKSEGTLRLMRMIDEQFSRTAAQAHQTLAGTRYTFAAVPRRREFRAAASLFCARMRPCAGLSILTAIFGRGT